MPHPKSNTTFAIPLLNILMVPLLVSFLIACGSETTHKAEVSVDTVFSSGSSVSAPVPGTLEQSLIDQGLVNIQDIDPEIMVDLKYSTEDNFFGQDVYGDLTKAYLQLKPAQALAEANKELRQIDPNLTLFVYDGVRPLRVQRILWAKLDTLPYGIRTNYVADPDIGSIHNFGCAVDLTIYDKAKDAVLDMGTPYDYFGSLAYPRMEDSLLSRGLLTETQIINRRLLRKIMTRQHFTPITSEWWHFNFHSRETARKNYAVIE